MLPDKICPFTDNWRSCCRTLCMMWDEVDEDCRLARKKSADTSWVDRIINPIGYMCSDEELREALEKVKDEPVRVLEPVDTSMWSYDDLVRDAFDVGL